MLQYFAPCGGIGILDDYPAHLHALPIQLFSLEEAGGKTRVALHLCIRVQVRRCRFLVLEVPLKPTAEMTSCRNLNGGLVSSFSFSLGLSTKGFPGSWRTSIVTCQ